MAIHENGYMPQAPEWAPRFRAHMKRHGQSQESLAEDLEVVQGTIGHWLRGRNPITLVDFLSLCAAAGADPRLILFGETTVQAALDTLKDRVLANNPDKQFNPPPPDATTMPPKGPRKAKAKLRSVPRPVPSNSKP